MSIICIHKYIVFHQQKRNRNEMSGTYEWIDLTITLCVRGNRQYRK